jgi:hypothetical protein
MGLLGTIALALLGLGCAYMTVATVRQTRFDEAVVPYWWRGRASTWPRFIRTLPLLYGASVTAILVVEADRLTDHGSRTFSAILSLVTIAILVLKAIIVMTGHPKKIAERRISMGRCDGSAVN